MEFFYIATLTILDESDQPFSEGYSARNKEDAESFRSSRIQHWEEMGYTVLKSHVGKRQVRKKYPTFGRKTKKESLI
jgi:hypothetical protein